MTDYHVTLEAAWLVRDIQSENDAIGVAISEAGKRLNPKMNYVEIEVGTTACNSCKNTHKSVFLTANTAIVSLILGIKVFDAKSSKHASRISKARIGKALRDVPLKVIKIEKTDSESE